MSDRTSTARFSDRVENYIRYRPGYPARVFDLLRDACGLYAGATVADVGAGTGISTKLLLDAGATVYAVEPNGPMRAAAEAALGALATFHAVDAPAEATTLPDGSIDLVTAFQAFHWFDRTRCATEFRRILKPSGSIALVWNERRIDATPFLRAYEQVLLTYATDYVEVRHENVSMEVLATFFAPAPFQTARFDNVQTFDFDGLLGRLESSSYAPAHKSERYEPMVRELRRIYERHAVDGRVQFEYDTRVHYGRPA